MSHSTLFDLIERYDAFLLDAYGVFWESAATGMLPGAKEAMETLVSRGKTVGILSNTTQLVEKEKIKLSKWGVLEGVHYHFLITSGECARKTLLQETLPFPTPRKSYCLFGTDHPDFSPHTTLFAGTAYQQTAPADADFMHIPIPHSDGVDREDPAVFVQKVEQAAALQLPILCTNPDRFAHEGAPPRPVVRQGMIAEMLEALGGEVHYIGKPYQAVYREALSHLAHIDLKKIAMVGDTPETDIRGAKKQGLGTILVTQTGITAARSSGNESAVFIAQLSASDQPDFAIPRFSL